MLPATAYPAPLPLGREATLKLLDRPDAFDATGGEFLTFMQIPLEERIGEWRFAGASRSLAHAVRRVGEFAAELRRAAPGLPADPLRDLLENTAGCEADGFVYPHEAPVAVGGPHRVVVCVQYGAPYEGLGVAVVEVESVAESAFAGAEPQTELPEEWQAADEE
jgi:hypothetical protein